MLPLLLVSAALAACPADPLVVSATLDRAEDAFAELDATRFRAEIDQALQDVDCLSSRADAALAARLHRARGLRAFIDGDEGAARAAFAAARAADPAYAFPDAFIPLNHPIRALYHDPGVAYAPVAVAEPAEGSLEFDGVRSMTRPGSWPSVVVWRDASGAVRQSAWLEPGEPLFAYPGTTGVSARGSTRSTGHPSRTLAIAAGASTLMGGGLLGAAKLSADRFWDPATPDGELEGLRTRTNTLTYGAAGLGALALGAGVGAVVVGRW